MEILNKSTYHLTVQASGTESIDTEIKVVNGYPPAKFIVTYFEGSGSLEVSQDGNVWLESDISENTQVPIVTTLPRYFRITEEGTKLIHLTSI
jgi:hypothetical protein